MAAPHQLKERIIVGIDFGTTFSGVAWAYSGQPDNIELVTDWDAEMHHCSDVEKAPTQIYFGQNAEDSTWGYSVPADKDALKWFKLLLLEERDLAADVAASDQIKEAIRLQKRANKSTVDVIGCFLRKLWSHAVDSIRRSIGLELLQKCHFHVVITLPAIWPPYAQQRMKEAAKVSGILDKRSSGETVLRFISEPEAAALATIKDLASRSTTKAGDTIVVCDAGGGTVDLISYIIENVEPFVVKECVRGDGGLCGGVFLDEGFIELIKKKVTPNAWESVSKADERKFLNDNWEHGIKPQFENQSRPWTVDLPESCPMGSKRKSGQGVKRRKTLELSSEEILTIFDPIMKKIRTLVAFQVRTVYKKYDALPKHIILVGGFGRSRYLFSCLEDEFGPDTTILQSRGNKPWSAICRGAVVQGLTQNSLSRSLAVLVESRIARMSCGIMVKKRFVHGIHEQCDKIWDYREMCYKATNQMRWFLSKGDDLDEKKPVRQSFYRLLDEGSVFDIEEDIYCCSVSTPSRKDDTVRHLCTIKWNKQICVNSLPIFTNSDREVFRKLTFEVEMTCADGTVDFAVYFKGEKVGGRNVQVDFS